MISLKVLSTAAAMALVLPIALSSGSFAQEVKAGGGAAVRAGGGAPAAANVGGSMRGGGSFAAGGGARFNGAAAAAPRMGGNVASGGIRTPEGGVYTGGYRGGAVAGGWRGGGYRYAGAGWNGGYRHHNRGFYPGFAAGAVLGSAVANSYAYYDPDYAYGTTGYYDDGYYDDTTVAVVPGGDDVASCAQRYRSYDPASQTYLGYDGLRHPCP